MTARKAGRALRCDVVWRRFVAGESIYELAWQLSTGTFNIEQALRRAHKRLAKRPRPKWRRWR